MSGRLVDTDGEGEDGTNGESSVDTYTLPRVKQAACGSSALCSVMTWRGGMGLGGREVQEGGGMCMRIADSHSCPTGTSTSL